MATEAHIVSDGVFASRWPRFLLRLSQSVADANLPRWLREKEGVAKDDHEDVPTAGEVAELWRRYVEALPQLADAATFTMSAFINGSFPPTVQLRVDAESLAQQWPSVWQSFFKGMVRQARDKAYWTLYGRDKAVRAADALRAALRRLLKFVMVIRPDNDRPQVAMLDDAEEVPAFREVDIEAETAFLSTIGADAPGEQPQPERVVKPVERTPHNVKYIDEPVAHKPAVTHAGEAIDWSKLRKA